MKPPDAAALAEFRRWAGACLSNRDDDGAFFKPDFLKDRSFCCVAFQGDFHDASAPIARLCSTAGIASLQCGSFAGGFEGCHTMAPRHDDLILFRRTYVYPSYNITDMFETFALVSEATITGPSPPRGRCWSGCSPNPSRRSSRLSGTTSGLTGTADTRMSATSAP